MPHARLRFRQIRIRRGPWRLGYGRIGGRLPDRPRELLKLLLEKPGETVTRAEISDRLWGGDTFVEFDDNLNHTVRKLRELLGGLALQSHLQMSADGGQGKLRGLALRPASSRGGSHYNGISANGNSVLTVCLTPRASPGAPRKTAAGSWIFGEKFLLVIKPAGDQGGYG